MKNNDYKVEFEEHRKEIGLDRNEDAVLPSRAERHGSRRKRKKTSSFTTINVILGIFTFIPIFIFVYVIFNFYFGSDSGSAKVDSNVPVEIGTNTPPAGSDSPGTVVVDADKEKEKEEEKENQTEEKVDKGTSADSKDETQKSSESVNPPAVDKKANPKVDEKPKNVAKTDTETTSRTHIVAANETLFRISMNYYGTDAGIEKIKKANGLSSNDIMAGQKLIIP